MRITVLLSCLLLFAAPAQAEGPRMTAQDLANMCISKSDLDFGMCAGYVMAVADALVDGSIGEYSACNHAHVRSQQYVDVYRSYAEHFPDKLSQDAETTVAAALSRAFPCLAAQ